MTPCFFCYPQFSPSAIPVHVSSGTHSPVSPSAIPVHSSLRPCPRFMFPISGCHPEPETRGLDCQRISEGSFLFPLNVLSVCFYQSRQRDPTKFNLDHSYAQVSPKQTLNSVCVDSAFISSSLLTSLLAALLPSVLFLK